MVFHLKLEHVMVSDCVHNRICVQLVAKSVCGRLQVGVRPHLVLLENGRARKSKEVVLFKLALQVLVHAPELGTVTLIEDEHHMLVVDLAVVLLTDKVTHLLDGRDHDLGVCALELDVVGGFPLTF